MDLPRFDGQGTGPQGSGGIPPEGFVAGENQQARAARELLGATVRPEDSQAAQDVLNREAEQLQQQLGLTQGQPQPQPPVQGQAPAGQIQQTQPGSAAQPQAMGQAPGETTDQYRERIRELRKKYGTSWGDLAQATVQAQETVQDQKSQIRNLESEVQGMRAQMAALMTSPRQEPERTPYGGGNGAAGQAGTRPASNSEDFWAQPEDRIRQIFKAEIDEYEAARVKREDMNEFERYQKQHAQELASLQASMSSMYLENRDVLDEVIARRGATPVLKLLHRTAKAESEGARANQFWREMDALDGNGNIANPAQGGVQMGGTLPMGGIGSRVSGAAPGAPLNGDWSSTKSFNRLMNTRSGSVNEDRAIVDILKERGFYE